HSPEASPGAPGPATATATACPGPGQRLAASGRVGCAPALTPPLPSARAGPGADMSSQETPQARRFPMEAGDSPGLAVAPEAQEPVAGHATLCNAVPRCLRRCPGSHCLTLPHIPIDVFLAMGGNRRPRTT
uniref:F229A protein n=1 Tax=Dromaius novaehollandiae TaxID=8790 RepID=A0A8C4K0P5_DRONO